jgi:hypothetical protein
VPGYIKSEALTLSPPWEAISACAAPAPWILYLSTEPPESQRFVWPCLRQARSHALGRYAAYIGNRNALVT